MASFIEGLLEGGSETPFAPQFLKEAVLRLPNK